MVNVGTTVVAWFIMLTAGYFLVCVILTSRLHGKAEHLSLLLFHLWLPLISHVYHQLNSLLKCLVHKKLLLSIAVFLVKEAILYRHENIGPIGRVTIKCILSDDTTEFLYYIL